jgi:hypothetical protein
MNQTDAYVEFKYACRQKQIYLYEVADALGMPFQIFYYKFNKRGFTINELLAALDAISASRKQRNFISSLNKFYLERTPVIVNSELISLINHELKEQDTDWTDKKSVCAAVLRYAGVKTKISRR